MAGWFACWTSDLPLPKRVGDELAKWHGALTSSRLWLADPLEPVCTLPYVELVCPKVDVAPAEPAQLRSAKSGEDRRD